MTLLCTVYMSLKYMGFFFMIHLQLVLKILKKVELTALLMQSSKISLIFYFTIKELKLFFHSLWDLVVRLFVSFLITFRNLCQNHC